MEDSRAQLILALRRGGIDNKQVMQAMERVPREDFVPEAIRDKSYENIALPIGHHQTISQPLTVALMTQALNLTDRMKVLEIGTGSGYQSSVLALLCRRLYTIERYRELMQGAEERFVAQRLTNITTKCGDGSHGWPEQAPFERIIVTAAAHDIPPMLVEQLAVGGIMVVPVNDGRDEHDQRLLRVTRTEDGVETEELGITRFVPLVEGDQG
ncbi:MAG: protein-L-isoaspartate(D-aspartate) O-methyltransferase [Rhodospirillaceae bacterium]|nr:protein-L-isoaspartate(D-aspartate) O-methyltransferase [Rhodospirillaceae bacterium]MBT5013342.1 protein-L-isoaspartate(D-aspartate) O-methyltransferase [Rhodospirillaceae bacterium]MBT5308022.1 protein-L-isoaspartate(D-aspartate) O-methyltransferase [Rhodospirillaceae bacterium]MBT6407281.1 protein-L-isoaspartate(D-aspartate) O-methyltransferase [Rhodospirillaceae bacterium]MBT7356247.1 protein-L-isoaspartate(D-aspartate) O-methyltransferase [Rhodospirillaceae bacterium]